MKTERWMAAIFALTGALTAAASAGAWSRPDKAAMDAAVADSFAQADVDGNGALSTDELTTFHTLMTQRRKADFVTRADANGDGQLTLDEIKAARPHRGGCKGGPPPAE